jgi:hypothetical protein
MEYQYRCWDIPAKKKVYGESPVFIFDPENAANRLPPDPDYNIARERWAFCPPRLKAMFVRAFTEGFSHPERRVTEGEWQNLFRSLKDSIITCPACHAENFTNGDSRGVFCWHCRQTLARPPFLIIHRPGGDTRLALSPGTNILARHLAPAAINENNSRVIGTVVRHPTIGGAAGIRNQSSSSWQVVFPDGSRADVAPGRAVPLNRGTTITMDGVQVQIQLQRTGLTS